jgi:hypothetical protein
VACVFLATLRRLNFPALVAWSLGVVVRPDLGKRQESALAQLVEATQINLGASVVVLDRSLDFDLAAFEAGRFLPFS